MNRRVRADNRSRRHGATCRKSVLDNSESSCTWPRPVGDVDDPLMRSRMLVLAGSLAAELELPSVAAYCRDQILRQNPRHLVRRWPTLGVALEHGRVSGLSQTGATTLPGREGGADAGFTRVCSWRASGTRTTPTRNMPPLSWGRRNRSCNGCIPRQDTEVS